MLETEPQNLQPDHNESSGASQDAGQETGHRRGLLRRGRRGVTKPAGPPAFKSGVTSDAEGGAGQTSSQGAARAPGGAVPVVPGVPGHQPGSDERKSTGQAAQQPVPAAAFQPPVLVFQPPDLGERGAVDTGQGRSGAAPDTGEESEAEDRGSRRRRRRGGRGRGKGGGENAGAEGAPEAGEPEVPAGDGGAGRQAGGQDRAAAQASASQAQRPQAASGEPGGQEADDEEGAASTPSRRRRRRRQRNGAAPAGSEMPSPDEPADTVVHIREPRAAAEPEDVRAVKGSTRLEAKRQRRREGRDTGRRRPPIISESEFLARREAVERVMVVRQQGERTQIAVLEDGVLVEHYVDRASHQSYVGNVYLGKVQNVLPSMEAAFVDIGKGRNAVLYAGEVNFDATGLEGVAKRIESALKSGQSIMVQVTKDPIGHKGARLTSQVSLPGRYLVYVPGASMTGISRKLPDTERTRLKQILKKVAPEEGGIIVRTAAEGASEEELSHDVTRLVAQWQAIERKAKTANAPDLLYGEPDLTIRVVRDIFNEDITKLVIASDSEWDLVDEYVRYVAPNLADRLERWSGDGDLFAAYRIDEQLAKALDRKVWLPSGGSLVIDTTEAMTVIDVNTGKFTGQGGNLEQTVTRNNLEAAEEIVRQLRLRDIGGIIVIDFIDMVLESNRDLVLRRLIECLARDRTKHQVAEVTSLGLVQMTRKRVGSGLLAAFSAPCEHCNGRGLLISTELTDVPASRNGQQGSVPKAGSSRSRSARSKAIAQVAAASVMESAADEGEAAPVAAEADVATAAPDVYVTPDAAPEPASAESGSSSRRRPRRSAHREAGPPDVVMAAAAAGDGSAVTTAADAAVTGQPAPDDLAATGSAQVEPASADGADAEAASAGPAAADAAGTEGSQTEPGRTEPPPTEPPPTEPAPTELAPTEPPPTEPPPTEPAAAQSAEAQPSAAGPADGEPGQPSAGDPAAGV